MQVYNVWLMDKSMEQIITNMNLLNRSIEGVIAVYARLVFSVTDSCLGRKRIRKCFDAMEIIS